ncbi:hypothetical protein CIG75_04820 [Tumebacillus algifaecis]|uniref:Uncharacterized protein n=1 Tax=Tumebacillus algifaecis TaxID=1214604 RepID=A0A223CYG9_9BACL|nr:hypothetical protein CIG75_04820 [Tumebacillus algifaecis]
MLDFALKKSSLQAAGTPFIMNGSKNRFILAMVSRSNIFCCFAMQFCQVDERIFAVLLDVSLTCLDDESRGPFGKGEAAKRKVFYCPSIS